jgi:hypothetical protein
VIGSKRSEHDSEHIAFKLILNKEARMDGKRKEGRTIE